jgi:hypothetical protein
MLDRLVGNSLKQEQNKILVNVINVTVCMRIGETEWTVSIKIIIIL